MFETAFALSLTQFARTFSAPERLQRRPARNAALEPWRLRNTGLDALFYDVKSLSAEETFYISDALASEGLIMIVPPGGQGMLTICDSVDEYRLRGGREVHAMAVAGIGGSAIGAAAFARNVANAIGEPVAAVVSGYGLGDIVNEAVGGAFFFGWLGHVRSNLEVIDDVVGRPKLGAYGKRDVATDSARKTGLDTDTVATLLADPEFSFTLLAGHSRGNRVIADALQSMAETAPARLKALAGKSRIVTFGGRIKMPEACTEVVDVVGELDWFGEINSRPKIKTDIRVPYCGHSTNTDVAGALQVTRILKDILTAAPDVATQAQDTLIEAAAAPLAEPVPEPVPEPALEQKPEPELEQHPDAMVLAPVVELATEPAAPATLVEDVSQETPAEIATAPVADLDEPAVAPPALAQVETATPAAPAVPPIAAPSKPAAPKKANGTPTPTLAGKLSAAAPAPSPSPSAKAKGKRTAPKR